MKYCSVKKNSKQYYPKEKANRKIKVRNNLWGILNPNNGYQYIANNRYKPSRIEVVNFKIMLNPKTNGFKQKYGVQYCTHPPESN
jgi:hypothetical protein